MTDRGCRHEEAVMQALRSGQWSPELRAHLAHCESCAEIEQVSGLMGKVAETWTATDAAPDARVIWLKAQLAEEQRRQRRALRGVILGQAAIKSVPAVALALLILWIWPTVEALTTRWLGWIQKVLFEPAFRMIERPLAGDAWPVLVLASLALAVVFLRGYGRRVFR